MKLSEINNSISTLPGVGPAKANLFANLNIFTVGDLLRFYPRDYEDRTQKISIAQCIQSKSAKVHTIAQVTAHEWFGYGRMKTLKIHVSDGTGNAVLVAFNRPFLEKSLPQGCIIALTGTFSFKYGELQSTQFDTEKISNQGTLTQFINEKVPNSKVIPIYHQTEGLTSKIISKIIQTALSQYSLGIDDEIPDSLMKKNNLLSKREALRKIHLPTTITEARDARRTFVYEELFAFQKIIAERSLAHRGKLPSIENDGTTAQKPVSDQEFEGSLSPRQKQLTQRLSFQLTQDQKAVITFMNYEIDRNFDAAHGVEKKSYAMRSLLQGDVGSGKTLVSFFVALRIIDYGSQCVLMAPTELLAKQHAENAARQLESVGVRVAYLTGNIKTKGREALLDALKKGDVDFIIGTHALFSKQVVYHDLALAIIDEQHRFGVLQRSAIVEKGRQSIDSYIREPNLLMMSATPIPQTLAQTVFGDLDVLTIKTMPQGRKPIITYLVRSGNEQNAYEAVRKQLAEGHQAYFVYPAIENNLETEDSAGFPEDKHTNQKSALKSAEEMFDYLSTKVYKEYKLGLIHSRIDEETQNKTIEDFRTNKIQILVATTVVEVGVDVPNATCMVIEQADRFGLAALHQLRGRVGRGSAQSYCFLVYRKDITETGIKRMKALRESTDGFKIAEQDLQMRGPGEITGTAQSGELTFKIADPVKDSELMQKARADAFAQVLSESEAREL